MLYPYREYTRRVLVLPAPKYPHTPARYVYSVTGPLLAGGFAPIMGWGPNKRQVRLHVPRKKYDTRKHGGYILYGGLDTHRHFPIYFFNHLFWGTGTSFGGQVTMCWCYALTKLFELQTNTHNFYRRDNPRNTAN